MHARHILFRVTDPADEAASKAAEAKAKAAVVKLKGGADFAKLAGELTEDPSGKADGGDLGYFTKDQMVPEFAEVAFKMEPGAISDPVKSQFGWHVIKVEDKRDRPVPEFEKVKDQLQVFVARKSQTDLVTKLRAEAKIERVEAKPPTAPAPAATALRSFGARSFGPAGQIGDRAPRFCVEHESGRSNGRPFRAPHPPHPPRQTRWC